MRKIVAMLVVAASAAVAQAAPPPSYLGFPSGYAVGKAEYHNFDFIELTYPDPASPKHGSLHAKPTGHWWRITITGDAKKFDFKLWRPALEKAGWQTLVDHGAVVARHPAGAAAGEAWLQYTGGDRFDLVETYTLPVLTLAAPAKMPEELKQGQDVPYLAPMPGLKVTKWEVKDDVGEEMTGPLTGGPFFAGPPVTRVVYLTPPEVSGLEVQATYQAALLKAGWTINMSAWAGTTTAHYSQNGRDIWAKVVGGVGGLHITVADLGEAAAAAKLKAALDKNGHVAVYGIYFDLDKDVLRPDSEATLQQILQLLQGFPKLRLEIQGHTDNTGSRPHNQTLSEARAASVKTWLVAHKVDTARLTTKGYADTMPVADNKSASGRAKNRRVELLKLK